MHATRDRETRRVFLGKTAQRLRDIRRIGGESNNLVFKPCHETFRFVRQGFLIKVLQQSIEHGVGNSVRRAGARRYSQREIGLTPWGCVSARGDVLYSQEIQDARRERKKRAGPRNRTRPTSYFLLPIPPYHLICPTTRISRAWRIAVGKSKALPKVVVRVITTLELSAL